MVVYADLFFLTNWAMDYLLLGATARLAGVRTAGWRLLTSSLLGAAYATAFLFPAARPLYSAAAKVAFSLVMVVVAFPVRSPGHLTRLWGSFTLLSLTAGGGALALACVGLPGAGGQVPGIPSVLLGLAVAGTLALAGRAWTHYRRYARLVVLPTEVALGGRRVVFPALVDTGNQLRDPFSGAPVVVVEYGTARSLVPRPLRPLLLGQPVPDQAGHQVLAERFCILPFVALAGQRGVLYGFRPDAVRVHHPDGWHRLVPVVVGVSPGLLSPDGWYRGLLPQEALWVQGEDRAGGGEVR